MITIKNVTPPEFYGDDMHTYDLRINEVLQVRFLHNHKLGLTACLRKAADTYDALYQDGKEIPR